MRETGTNGVGEEIRNTHTVDSLPTGGSAMQCAYPYPNSFHFPFVTSTKKNEKKAKIAKRNVANIANQRPARRDKRIAQTLERLTKYR